MQEITSVAAMQAWSEEARRRGERIALVPTMGYLHAGHLSLVDQARRRCDRVVVSIFVNPLQFGAGEDLDRYPRDLARDRRLLEEAGADAIYLPDAESMYPPGFQTEVRVSRLTRGLCGKSRPTHFAGVTTIVAKLFNAVRPHVAVFGEKDYQQLAVIRRMAADLDFGIDVVGAPIVREADGLAMSSRNAYLSAEERNGALRLSQALTRARERVASGETDASIIVEEVRRHIAARTHMKVDYVELVDAETLEPLARIDRPAVLAVAVFAGNTRLIDNTAVGRDVPVASSEGKESPGTSPGPHPP